MGYSDTNYWKNNNWWYKKGL